MFNYLVENLLENLVNVALWVVVGWLFFRPSKSAKVAAIIVGLIALASYIGQIAGDGSSTETWVWIVATSLVGLGLGAYIAPRRGLSGGRMSHEEMVAGLRRIVDDPDTPADKREGAASRLAALERRKV